MTRPKGRFRKPLDPRALAFSTSLAKDRRLYREDIEGSLAHVAMLVRRGIIASREGRRIAAGLRSIRREIDTGRFDPLRSRDGRFAPEDIHMAIEARLIRKIGPAGGKLHTARSRNDQVALDERLYLRSATKTILPSLRRLQRALSGLARRYRDVVMPGYTHLQRAQPVLLAHHLLAYVEMLDRDHGRFADCWRRADVSPLGSGALAGTSFPIDRNAVARSLGLSSAARNSIDAVSDRDAVIEHLSAAAIAMMHLSRLAEELVLWSSQEWRFVELSDTVTTGSSIMPQKKNPDMAELVRAKTGRVYGDLMALLTVMKGLPLAYNRDLQEDKEPLFDATDTLLTSLSVMTLVIGGARFDRRRFEGELNGDFLLATELADYLARKGLPFREAHTLISTIVQECEGRGIGLQELPLEEYRKRSRLFTRDLYAVLDPRASVRRKRSSGSTSPSEVRKALAWWSRKLR